MTTTTVSHLPRTYAAADFEKINNPCFQGHTVCEICKSPNANTQATKVELACKHVFCKDCADLLTPRSNKRFRACLLCKEDRMPVRYFSITPEGLKIELNPELVSITLTTAYVAALSNQSPTFKEMHDAAFRERLIQQRGGPLAAIYEQSKKLSTLLTQIDSNRKLIGLSAQGQLQSILERVSTPTNSRNFKKVVQQSIVEVQNLRINLAIARANPFPLEASMSSLGNLGGQIRRGSQNQQESSRASDVLPEATTARRRSESNVEDGMPQPSSNGASSTPSSDKNLPK